MMSYEKFKSIPGFPQYDVGSCGSHKSIVNWVNKEIVTQRDLNGYLVVRLVMRRGHSSSLTSIPKYVHRLVADAFVTPPFGPRALTAGVRHIDGNLHNNHYLNLEFVKEVEDVDYRILTGMFKEPVVEPRAIYCVQLDEVFPSINMAAQVLRIQRSNLVSHLKGRLKHVSGYTFTFVEEDA